MTYILGTERPSGSIQLRVGHFGYNVSTALNTEALLLKNASNVTCVKSYSEQGKKSEQTKVTF